MTVTIQTIIRNEIVSECSTREFLAHSGGRGLSTREWQRVVKGEEVVINANPRIVVRKKWWA